VQALQHAQHSDGTRRDDMGRGARMLQKAPLSRVLVGYVSKLTFSHTHVPKYPTPRMMHIFWKSSEKPFFTPAYQISISNINIKYQYQYQYQISISNINIKYQYQISISNININIKYHMIFC
jgi:hypothetical protein